jgi:hypothetical protein
LRRSKYGAKPTTVDGIRFASMKEAARYRELRLLEKAGETNLITLQEKFPLLAVNPVTGEATKIGEYRADFSYVSKGEWIIEDVKGFKTPLYRWKKKHVEAQYGIEIREV